MPERLDPVGLPVERSRPPRAGGRRASRRSRARRRCRGPRRRGWIRSPGDSSCSRTRRRSASVRRRRRGRSMGVGITEGRLGSRRGIAATTRTGAVAVVGSAERDVRSRTIRSAGGTTLGSCGFTNRPRQRRRVAGSRPIDPDHRAVRRRILRDRASGISRRWSRLQHGTSRHAPRRPATLGLRRVRLRRAPARRPAAPRDPDHRHRRRHPLGRHRPRAGANAVTLVRGERILCAGAAGECPSPTTPASSTPQGRWLIPGLIDSHVHLLFLTSGSAGEELALDLRDLLAQGITTVRDMGTNPAELLARARALAGGAPGLRDAARRRPPVLLQRLPRHRARRAAWSTGSRPRWRCSAAAGRRSMYQHRRRSRRDRRRGPGGRGDRAQALRPPRQRIGPRLTEAGHRAGMPVWGHAWVQPASVAASRCSPGRTAWCTPPASRASSSRRRSATPWSTTATSRSPRPRWPRSDSAHDPRVLAALDSMARARHLLRADARRGRATASPTSTPTAPPRPLGAGGIRPRGGRFGMEVAREAVRRGVRISAGSDHVAYGPGSDRASLVRRAAAAGRLDRPVTRRAALLAATRDAALAIGGEAARAVGTIEAGRYADLVLLAKNPLEDIANLESVEWSCRAGRSGGRGSCGAGSRSAAVRRADWRDLKARYARDSSATALVCPLPPSIGSSSAPPTRSTSPRRSAPADSPSR